MALTAGDQQQHTLTPTYCFLQKTNRNRSAPEDPADWAPDMADRLSARIAQLAATNATDVRYQSPWAVEVAERAPDVSVAVYVRVLECIGVWCRLLTN